MEPFTFKGWVTGYRWAETHWQLSWFGGARGTFICLSALHYSYCYMLGQVREDTVSGISRSVFCQCGPNTLGGGGSSRLVLLKWTY